MSESTIEFVDKPRISDAERDALDAGASVCIEVRPGTLGHQLCWRIEDHRGPHVSQDGQAWQSA